MRAVDLYLGADQTLGTTRTTHSDYSVPRSLRYLCNRTLTHQVLGADDPDPGIH